MPLDEWIHKYNPYNSDKVLAWRDRFEDIMQGKIPRPVTVTLDISNICNISCNFCQYSKFRNKSPVMAEWTEIEWLANEALPKLDPRSICLAGGGEFLCHPKASDAMYLLKKNNFRLGMITNGTRTDIHLDAILNTLDWIGFSIDTSNTDTYKAIKGGKPDDFFRVIENMKNIIQNRKNKIPTVGYKFLLTKDNYTEVRDACKLAKSIGVDYFHIRPVLLPGVNWFADEINEIHVLIERCMALDSEDFHVFGITHKFNPDFTKRVIQKCEVTPIAGMTFTADGNCYACCDLRGIPMGFMCQWREILDFWGTDKHREVIDKINPKQCPNRCTYGPHQIILDEVFRKNKMNYEFP